jgi:Uma2 family endonuclease
MAKPANFPVTPEEYLRQERARTEGRAELLDGEIVMMAGATRRHNRIARNILVSLDSRFGDGPCEAFVADMRVKAVEAEAYTYPDVVIACADAEFEDELDDTLTNPLAIFEVLSPSTRGRDRGDKFAYYRTIPSLRHYVLVDTQAREVDHYARQGNETWLLTTLRGDDLLRLDPPGVELSLDEIYRRAGL